MVDSLNCLRHDAVVSCYNDDSHVSHLSTTGTHRRKRLMTRSIKECNPLAISKFNMICTDMLSDTAGLTSNHIRITDVVEKRSLTVVNVTHHGNYRWTWKKILI